MVGKLNLKDSDIEDSVATAPLLWHLRYLLFFQPS